MSESNTENNFNSIEKGWTIPVLDNGYVTVRNWMGSEIDIVEAARLSYGTGTRKISENTALLRYLLRHAHTSPFEMCELQLEIKLPIFVARQWARHRTANVNEYSARYSEMEDDFYVPNSQNIGRQSNDNKQGRSEELDFTKSEIESIKYLIETNGEGSFEIYNTLLGKETDTLIECEENYDQELDLEIARELARIVLPLNTYTKMIWKCDVNNLLKFLNLRVDKHAQYEIRVYAQAIEKILQAWMPNLYEAYVDYIRDSSTLSKQQLDLTVKYIQHLYENSLDKIQMYKPENMSKREFNDLLEILEL